MTIQEAREKLAEAVRSDLNAATHGHVAQAHRVTDAVEILIRAVVEDLISRPKCRGYLMDRTGSVYYCNKPEGHVSSHRDGFGGMSWDDP